MKTTVLALLALASSAVSAPNPCFDINGLAIGDAVSAREVEALEDRSICSLEDIILLLLPSKDKQSASAFCSGYLQQTLTTTSTSSIVTMDTFLATSTSTTLTTTTTTTTAPGAVSAYAYECGIYGYVNDQDDYIEHGT
jgi:hypothetical protein